MVHTTPPSLSQWYRGAREGRSLRALPRPTPARRFQCYGPPEVMEIDTARKLSAEQDSQFPYLLINGHHDRALNFALSSRVVKYDTKLKMFRQSISENTAGTFVSIGPCEIGFRNPVITPRDKNA